MRLFFYGTLMSGNCRGHVLGDLAQPVGAGSLRGDLYCGYSFPAMTDGDGTVHGEVWEVRPGCEEAVLRITDGIEGYYADNPQASMYLRAARPLVDGDPTVLAGDTTVLTYIWNGSLGSRWTPVPDGRWEPPRRWAA